MTRLYDVKLADLASYQLSVAANNEREACAIAKTVLCEEATPLAKGLTIASREVDATATEKPTQLLKLYDLLGTYSVDFSIRIPATSAAEAELHGKRMFAENPHPYEHDFVENDVSWRYAREVEA